MNVKEFFYPLSFSGIIVALICGFIVGIERQLCGKAAGIRTSILICLGAYIFSSIGSTIYPEDGPPRIVGQIITGIGFLGAGVILAREGIVIGVTTAAVIWVLAGIGVMIGLDRPYLAIMLSVLVVCVLSGVSLLEKLFTSLRKGIYDQINKRIT
jgi:putative Mg2+ transporter-C (MgtC) family protein